MRLRNELLFGGLTRIEEIGRYLEGLDLSERLEEIHSLCPSAMAMLYARAAEAPPIGEAHFVPEGTPALTQVIHHGWNSLPAFRGFQKRFCVSRTAADGAPEIVGYNNNPPLLKSVGITPGYFRLRRTAGLAHWERRGALVIDYHEPPPAGPVAPGWPRIIPNSVGLQKLAFDKTRDFMRKVSAQVSIGAAYKWEQALGVYFVLCRED
ncbi:MAG: hypothetical protein RBU30_20645 [Polyangia bacterium]|jgi:hypothetical protein|nr:hypothetical protein [Polyangia bacterium]